MALISIIVKDDDYYRKMRGSVTAGTLDLLTQVHGVLLLAPHPREFEVTLPPHSGLSSLWFSGWWVLVGPA